MKKLLWIVLATFFLAACGIQSVEEHERMEAEERSVEEVVSKPEKPEPLQVKEEPAPEIVEEKATEKAVPKEEPVKVELPKVEVQPEQKPKETPKPEPKAEEKPAPEAKSEPVKQVAAPVQESTPVQEPQPEVKKRTVTIAIYVHSLVANMDKLHPSLQSEKYVPASGVILKPMTYELLSEKDTVWDVLKRATKEHQIQLEYEGADENVYDSVYIEGMNHLYEFSAGPLSGWMYNVNGTFPNYGASQYTLEDGDVIEWHYTVDLGRDLGKGV